MRELKPCVRVCVCKRAREGERDRERAFKVIQPGGRRIACVESGGILQSVDSICPLSLPICQLVRLSVCVSVSVCLSVFCCPMFVCLPVVLFLASVCEKPPCPFFPSVSLSFLIWISHALASCLSHSRPSDESLTCQSLLAAGLCCLSSTFCQCQALTSTFFPLPDAYITKLP